MVSIFDHFPDHAAATMLRKDPHLRKIRGKHVTKQDAYKLLEKAALHAELEDFESAAFYHNLALDVLLRARSNRKLGVETRGRPSRK